MFSRLVSPRSGSRTKAAFTAFLSKEIKLKMNIGICNTELMYLHYLIDIHFYENLLRGNSLTVISCANEK